jgi:hypothetical protein
MWYSRLTGMTNSLPRCLAPPHRKSADSCRFVPIIQTAFKHETSAQIHWRSSDDDSIPSQSQANNPTKNHPNKTVELNNVKMADWPPSQGAIMLAITRFAFREFSTNNHDSSKDAAAADVVSLYLIRIVYL